MMSLTYNLEKEAGFNNNLMADAALENILDKC